MIRTITPIFSVIIALVVFFVHTKPQFAEVERIQGETTEYEDAVKKAQELNEMLSEKIAKKAENSPEDLMRLGALASSTIDEVKVLTDLSEIARSHNMLFGNVSVTNAESNPKEKKAQTSDVLRYQDITNTDVEFALIGTYEQFKAFLADIERSIVLLEVTNIEFSAGEGTLQQYSVTVRLFALPS